MNTLYVSDLDGTLLNSDVKISENSKNIINTLIDKGMNFTVATARSLVSASDKIEGLNLKLPVVVYNGTFTMMKDTGEIVNSNYFDKADRDFIIENMTPLLSAATFPVLTFILVAAMILIIVK